MIGLEREKNAKPAGFRTNILVTVGSTLIMLVSIKMRLSFNDLGVDPGRIAAQVVSGIGFLGAGTIIREGFSVKGLTTAAGIWAVAGVGLALGAGFYISAVSATILVILTLNLLNKVESNIYKEVKAAKLLRIKTADQPRIIGEIGSVLEKNNIIITNINVESSDGEKEIHFNLKIKKPEDITDNEILTSLTEVEEVVEVKLDQVD